ncbi:MAG TPA: hypothetical protein VGB89_00030, partial [Bacteroidota bacterium]
MQTRKWTAEEIALLRRYYRKKGAKYVAECLGRNPDTVMAKAAKLGVRYQGIRPWRMWEDRYLQRKYKIRKTSSIARTLKRSVPSVAARAKKFNLLGTRSPNWSEKEK